MATLPLVMGMSREAEGPPSLTATTCCLGDAGKIISLSGHSFEIAARL